MTLATNLTGELKEVTGFVSSSSGEWVDRMSGSQTSVCVRVTESLLAWDCWTPPEFPTRKVWGGS